MCYPNIRIELKTFSFRPSKINTVFMPCGSARMVSGKKLSLMTSFPVITESHAFQMLIKMNCGSYCWRRHGHSYMAVMSGLKPAMLKTYSTILLVRPARSSRILIKIFLQSFKKPIKTSGLLQPQLETQQRQKAPF